MTKQIVYTDSNRVAKLDIMYEQLEQNGPMLAALMGLVVVLQVEEHPSGRGKTFIVACKQNVKLFQELNEDDEIPEYRLEFVHDGKFEDPAREASRTNSGRYGFAAIRKTILRVPPVEMAIAIRSARVNNDRRH